METLDGAVEGFDLTQTYKNGKSVNPLKMQRIGGVHAFDIREWERN